MSKIAFIGAGSAVFTKHVLIDILCHPELRESTIALMDIDQERLDLIDAVARQIVERHEFPTRIQSTMDRREALDGADFVVCTIQVGRENGFVPDMEIPIKYGVKQCIGDTLGPGGVFRTLRTGPVMIDICRDMEELCPDALLINYSNPMAMLCWIVAEATSVNCVGLCHSVQGTTNTIAGYLGLPPEELACWVAGINHMAWFLKLERDGENLYPLLREKLDDESVYNQDRVRFEILRYFGHFVTESSGHLSEYLPYFRRSDVLIDRYCTERFGGETGFYLRVADELGDQFFDLEKKVKTGDEPWDLKPSGEYAADIIHAIQTGSLCQINGNVANTGLITNLPDRCCVEVPCLVNRQGVQPCFVGDLPPHLAALDRTNVNVQELAVRAILENDPERVFQAIALDPLTASVLPLDQIRDMVNDLFDAEQEMLPQFLQTARA